MKRVLASVLVLCLLCGAAGLALGESEGAPLRVLDGWWAAEAYQRQYPERAIESIAQFDDQGNSVVESVVLSGEWDAVCVDTTAVSLAMLDGLGLTLDLGSVEQAAALAENMYPAIRAGCSVGDKLVALPAGFLGTHTYSYQLLGMDYQGEDDPEGMALRQQLGFTAQDQPATFAEVCALGLRYMALSREARKGTLFLFSDSAPQGFSLLYNLISCYLSEVMDESGHADFDTPAFRAALDCAAPLLAAFAADPKRTYGADGSLSVVLSDNIGVSSYGVYPRVTEGTAIPAFMTVVLVNPRSERLSEAIDFALIAAQGGDSNLPLFLYQNADYDALLWQSYDRDIAAQIEEGESQAVIDELKALQAAGDDSRFTPKRVVEHYAGEISPRLVFPRWSAIPTDDAIFAYLAGKIDADGFIARLNESQR